MRRFSILLLALTLAFPAVARQRAVRPAPEPQLLTEVDQIAAEALADGVPGFVAAVAYGNRLVFQRAYGLQRLGTADTIETDTIFQVGSVTKQFTGAAIMKLVEQGKLSVDADVREIIPELQTGDWVVTIEHLLTHTGGIPNSIEATIDPHQPVTHAQMIARLNEKPMAFRPGDRYEYNNAGYYLLGIVIERVSGVPYAEFLEQQFLHPLGLVDTAYCGRPPAWPIPDGYVELAPLPPIRFDAMDMTIPFAAGALCSTAEDLVRWAAALNEGRAVTAESFDAMNDDYQLNGGGLAGYGYGLGVSRWNGMTVLSHSGAIPGFSSFLLTIPETGYTIAVVANLFSTDRGPAADIALDIAALMLE